MKLLWAPVGHEAAGLAVWLHGACQPRRTGHEDEGHGVARILQGHGPVNNFRSNVFFLRVEQSKSV